MDQFLSKKWVAFLGAFFCTVLWGSAYPVIKFSYQKLNIESTGDQLMFAAVRFLLAGLMVFFLCLVRKKKVPTVEKKYVGAVILYGAVQTGFMYLLNYIGVANTTATKTSILTALAAFLAVLFAPLFFKNEKLTVLKLFGIALGFSGIILINTNFFSGSFSFFGEGFVLLSALLNTAGGFISKKICAGRVFETTAFQLQIGAAILFLSALFFGGGLRLSWSLLLLELYLAFVSAAAFSLWSALLVRHDAGDILIFNLFIPITGAFWSYLILGEKEIFDPLYFISVLLIAAGIILVNSHRKSGNISTNHPL